jgi:hypothetical protein
VCFSAYLLISLHSVILVFPWSTVIVWKLLVVVLYVFFWVFPRRQIVCGVLRTQPLKMELTEGSETSANHNLTSGKYPKEYIQYSKHGESLKSRILLVVSFSFSSLLRKSQYSVPRSEDYASITYLNQLLSLHHAL